MFITIVFLQFISVKKTKIRSIPLCTIALSLTFLDFGAVGHFELIGQLNNCRSGIKNTGFADQVLTFTGFVDQLHRKVVICVGESRFPTLYNAQMVVGFNLILFPFEGETQHTVGGHFDIFDTFFSRHYFEIESEQQSADNPEETQMEPAEHHSRSFYLSPQFSIHFLSQLHWATDVDFFFEGCLFFWIYYRCVLLLDQMLL